MFEIILSTLVARDIRFLLVGGVAATFHTTPLLTLTSTMGAIDVLDHVPGVGDYADALKGSETVRVTPSGPRDRLTAVTPAPRPTAYPNGLAIFTPSMTCPAFKSSL